MSFRLSTRTDDDHEAAGPDTPARESSSTVVDDGVPLGPGQVNRSRFLDEIAGAVGRAADEELAPLGRTSRDCPHLAHWIGYYRDRSAAHLERAIRHYARPVGSDPESLRDAVVERVRRAVRSWAGSGGQVVDAPGGVSPLGPDDGLTRTAAGTPIRRMPTATGSGTAGRTLGVGAIRGQLGSGRPLDLGTRTRMERGLGRDLSRVRIHADSTAARLASTFSARAFTLGPDVAFGAGQYRPGTLTGDALLAHELAHTTQPGGLAETDAEREANRATVGVLLGRPAARSVGPAGGLQLRRCGGSTEPMSPEVELSHFIIMQLDLEGIAAPHTFDATRVLERLRNADPAVVASAVQILKLRAESEHTNYYHWFIRRMQERLDGAEWAEAKRLLGIDPLSGPERIELSEQGRALLIRLQTLMAMAAPTTIGSALSSLRAMPAEEVNAVLTVLHRTPDAGYGNALFRLSATIQRQGTEDQYRAFIRFLHEADLPTALDEADPKLGVLAERQAHLNQTGEPSDLTDDEMAGLFASRALEMAYTMLRDSERQLIRVLSRTEGGGGEAADLDADVGQAVEVLNKNFDPDFQLISFDDYASRIRPILAARGQYPTDEQLRPTFNRQRQIILYRLGAAREKLVVAKLAGLRPQIEDLRDELRGPHTYIGRHPLDLSGPVGAWRRRQQLEDRLRRQSAKLQRLERERDAYAAVQRDVERVLPLLGGLDADGLQRLADLPGGAQQFDQILQGRLSEIFGNIEKARGMLHDGEVKVWLLPPVVKATKKALGIPDEPQNDTQRRWNRVINERIASAKADEERTRKILEILNAGALIAAIGASLFTGGGSLALYIGVAGTGLGLGTAVYDVVEAHRRTGQAETLYGTALTEGARLSDVPPDYRFLHMAWLNLGVNVVLSVLTLRSMAGELSTALRGEEAAVRSQARKMARKLRAAGETLSEEELVEATMAALRQEGWVAGSVRGARVYDVHPTRREWVAGPGRSLENQVDTLTGRTGLHGSSLQRPAAVPTPATGGATPGPSVYQLRVPGPSGRTITVDVTFNSGPASTLPAGVHGAESGPARLTLTSDLSGNWRATVHVHEGLRPEAFPFAVGHELDEIAAAVRKLPPTATAAEIAEQMQARVFRPGGIGPNTTLTAHDEAALAELRSLLDDLNQPGLRAVQKTAKQARLETLLQEMGLREAEDIGVRIAALRAAGLDTRLNLIELEQTAVARRAYQQFLQAEELSTEAVIGRNMGTTIIDEDFVKKLLYPQGRNLREFTSFGVRGGHVDSELLAFERANPEYAFLETSPTPPRPGREGFHRYEQYRWNQPTSPPPLGSPLRPGGLRFNPADWVKSNQLKTTASDLQSMLLEMEDAFSKWRIQNSTLATTQTQWGRGLSATGAVGSGQAAISKGGIEFSGYFTYTPATSTTLPQWRIRSGFVDASWF